jgi:pantoate--beta-alanine ligase
VQVFTTAARLTDFIQQVKAENPSLKLGFVPTMGALHAGHMKLIEEARAKSDFVVASIFVNPTQFNDPKDLARYPRTLDADLKLLQDNGCNAVYTPAVEDIYPNGTDEPYTLDFGGIDQVMEGAFRPGHFNGVAQVVERFFVLVQPDMAFFGRKDFQQVAIIKQLVKLKHLPIQVVVVNTARNAHGLALSSRNTLLSEEQKKEALIIFETLSNAVEWAKTEKDAQKLKDRLIAFFNSGKLRLEYLEICNDTSLQPVKMIQADCTCCIAAFCGPVRLIDNMSLNG